MFALIDYAIGHARLTIAENGPDVEIIWL